MAEIEDGATLAARRAAGELDAAAYRRARLGLRRPAEWRAWLDRLLLWGGVALVLAGVVFFFAANWGGLGVAARFGVLEGAVVGAALGAAALGLDAPAGAALLFAACVLVGVFLAVLGQTYQSGADAWQLFAGWAGLVLPWVAVSRSAACWVLLAALANLAVALWGGQVAEPAGWLGAGAVAALGGLVSLGALAAREAAAPGRAWLAPPWSRRVLLGLGLAQLAAPAALFAYAAVSLRWRELARQGPGAVVPLLLLGPVVAAGVRAYRGRDAVATTMVVSAAGLVAWSGGMALLRGLRVFRGGFLVWCAWTLGAATITLGVGLGVGRILAVLAGPIADPPPARAGDDREGPGGLPRGEPEGRDA